MRQNPRCALPSGCALLKYIFGDNDMQNFLKRTWAEINLDALKHNYEQIKGINPQAKAMAVIKADAYGHGAVQSARVLRRAGAEWFGVSNIEEAIELRIGGIGGEILILGYTPPEYADKLIGQGITQTVYSLDYAKALSGAAQKLGGRIKVHIKADTGMTRLGFLCQHMSDIPSCSSDILAVSDFSGLDCEGIFMHFPCADSLDAEDVAYTKNQFDIFSSLIAELESHGMHFRLRHCCNSAAAILYPEMHMDMIRAGVALYGLHPSRVTVGKINLLPVMELKSVISSIKDVTSGTFVSYGRTEHLSKAERLAVVPIGYADGYRRCLSGKAFMLVNGSRAKIVGRVCMDQTIIDISGIDGVRCGQEVICFGRQGNGVISVDELADIEGTINYEIVCLIGKRVTKVYYENGAQTDIVGLLKH